LLLLVAALISFSGHNISPLEQQLVLELEIWVGLSKIFKRKTLDLDQATEPTLHIDHEPSHPGELEPASCKLAHSGLAEEVAELLAACHGTV